MYIKNGFHAPFKKYYYDSKKELNVKIANLPKNGTAWVSVFIATLALILSGWQTYLNYQDKKISDERSQAQKIAVWISYDGGDAAGCTLINSSSNPVYDIVITPVLIQGVGPHSGTEMRKENPNGPEAILYIMPPGKYTVSLMNPLEYAMGLHYGVEYSFRDSNGVSWLVKSDGSLHKIPDSLKYYKIYEPISYSDLLDADALQQKNAARR